METYHLGRNMTTFGAEGNVLKSPTGPVKISGGAAPDEEQLVPPTDLTDFDAEIDKGVQTAKEAAAALDPTVEKAIAEAATDDDPEDDDGLSHTRPVVIDVDQPGKDVEVIDAETEEPGNVIALADRFEVTKSGEAWPYDMLEFKGDLLGIRLPTRQALAAFSLASSKYVSLGVKNDLTGLFIARHLSPESYSRVFSRLMDPDEDDYDVDTVGELFNAIVTAAVEADKAADKAKGDDTKK